jgi:hypothetical protein
MYSLRVHRVSHTMNQNNNKKSTSKSQAKKAKPRRDRVIRDPLPIRTLQKAPRRDSDIPLALTRSQFTATSPQTYWENTRASTPGGLRFKAAELVGSVVSTAALTGAFALLNIGSYTAFPINPTVFPRLAKIAAAYQFYLFHKLNVYFKSNQPTTAGGMQYMCIDTNANDSAPANAVAVSSKLTNADGNVYSCSSMQHLGTNARLTRFVIANESDTSQLDQGVLYVAIDGVTAASGVSFGNIVLEYDVELFTPQ